MYSMNPPTDTTEPSAPNEVVPQPQAITPVLIPVAKKPKTLLWLWITLTVAGLMIISLIISYVVIEKSATAAAVKYIDTVESYLDDIYDTATSAADEPSEVRQSLSRIDVPQLENAFLGDLSVEYQDARQLQYYTAMNIDTLTTKLDEYARVYDFYDSYQSINDDITTLSETADDDSYLRTFEEILEKLVEIKNLANEADLPDELHDSLVQFDAGMADQVSSWTSLIDAFSDENQVAYKIAYEKYVAAVLETEEAAGPIISYNNSLSSKVRAAASGVREFSETIK